MSRYDDVRASFHNLLGVSGNDVQNAYGMQGDWCMMTVWTAFRNAGALDYLADGMKTAWVPSLWDWYDNRGMTGTEPRAGALVFYELTVLPQFARFSSPLYHNYIRISYSYDS